MTRYRLKKKSKTMTRYRSGKLGNVFAVNKLMGKQITRGMPDTSSLAPVAGLGANFRIATKKEGPPWV